MHVKALQELGIDLTKAQKSEPVKQSKPIDDLLK
jgi:hypothetical protein